MRFVWLVALVACGSDSSLQIDEADCVDGAFHFAHSIGGGDEGAVPIADAFFLNANNPPGHIALGYLALVRDGAEFARVEFAEILSGGTTVDARGYVKLVDRDIDVGHCRDAGVPFRGSGRISMDADFRFLSFTLEDLHASPYCTGPAAVGAFAGCTVARN